MWKYLWRTEKEKNFSENKVEGICHQKTGTTEQPSSRRKCFCIKPGICWNRNNTKKEWKGLKMLIKYEEFFFYFSIFIYFLFFIFKLYKIVLVLPNIKMNPPQVYMCSPSWTLLLPPPSPSHPSGSSQCTSPKHPVSCIEPGLTIFQSLKWLSNILGKSKWNALWTLYSLKSKVYGSSSTKNKSKKSKYAIF